MAFPLLSQVVVVVVQVQPERAAQVPELQRALAQPSMAAAAVPELRR
jgi:hypothetical protein